MINLIPNQNKKEMVKDFYFRLAILFFVVLGVSLLIVSVSILPSYFITSVKNTIVDSKLKMQKNEPVPLPEERTLSIIKDINNKLSLFEKPPGSVFTVSSKVINAIILKKMSGIKITNISYENNSKNNFLQVKKITIQGTAPSRSVLLLFRQALEDDATFKSVDLPISNFVKGSDIRFYLSLIPS